MVFNTFKTVKLFIQIKPHGEPQYIEELEADRQVKAEKGGDEGSLPSGTLWSWDSTAYSMKTTEIS